MSETNELSQSLLDAVQLMSESAASNTGATLTVKCTITKIVDAGLGIYQVKYGENFFNVNSGNPDIKYGVDDIVYILVPDGDFSQQKFIIGRTASRTSILSTEDNGQFYIPINDNLLGNLNAIELCSQRPEERDITGISEDFNSLFSDYLNTYRNFLFSATIKTNIPKDYQMKGNYGLILKLPFVHTSENGELEREYRMFYMDVSNIPGNPYNLSEYQIVNLYYNISEDLVYDTSEDAKPELQAFVRDFGYLDVDEQAPADIFIKDISVQMVDVLTQEERLGYCLTIVSDSGNYFVESGSKKVLKPTLKIKGSDSNVKNWDCYWFVEDASVTLAAKNEDYLNYGGPGWKCLNEKTNVTYDNEGNKVFQYVTDKYSYEVSFDDVEYKRTYKCVLIKDDIIITDTLQLINLFNISKRDTQLVSNNELNTFIAGIGKVNLIARIYYDGITQIDEGKDSEGSILISWQRLDRYGNTLTTDHFNLIRNNDPVEINGKIYWETEINFPCVDIDQFNTVKCTFFKVDKNAVKKNIATESIVLSTKENFTYGINIYDGDVLYKYDSDGDSPKVANYDGPMTSVVKTIKPIYFKVFKADGTELTDTEYLYCNYKWSFPKNSMMKLEDGEVPTSEDDDYYYLEGHGQKDLRYDINNTYNKKKNNNTIILNIDFDNCSLSEVVTPKFLKDGESGTNGTKYSSVITYDNFAYGEKDANGKSRKLHLVYINNTGVGSRWFVFDPEGENRLMPFDQKIPTLNINVYKDGELIDTGYSITWRIFDSAALDKAGSNIETCFSINNNGVLSIREGKDWSDSNKNYCNVIEAFVTVGNAGTTNSQESTYAYYPIEITRLENNEALKQIIPRLEGGYEQVLYASDGTNPQYDNTNSFECIDNLYDELTSLYYIYQWEFSQNLIEDEVSGQTALIKPVTKFDNGVGTNYIKVSLTVNKDEEESIENLKNQIAAQADAASEDLEFYEKHKAALESFLGKGEEPKSGYLTLLNSLDQIEDANAKKLLLYRGNCLLYINNIIDQLIKFYEYCNYSAKISTDILNYIDIYNTNIENLFNAYKEIYLLDIIDNFDNIKNNIHIDKISITDEQIDLILNTYGAGVYSSLMNLIDTYNNLIEVKYNVSLNVLIEQDNQGQYILYPGYEKLYEVSNSINVLLNDEDFKELAGDEDTDPSKIEKQFLNIRVQLKSLNNLITDYNTKLLISYTAFNDEFIDPIKELLNICSNWDYEKKYYEDIINNLTEEYNKYDNQANDLQKLIDIIGQTPIIHIKPIIMLFNRYEMSNLNGWDGNKLYIDKKNETYLLAPQVGAGVKNTDNTFTGIVIGVEKVTGSNNNKIGLFGYSNGARSIFLNAKDGSATFGVSGKGQIQITPGSNSATITGGNYNYTGNPDTGSGMLIDLYKPEIKFGTGNFEVTSKGHLTAKGGGCIGDWKIGNDNTLKSSNGNLTLDASNSGKIYSNNHNNFNSTSDGFYISGDGLSIGSQFSVNKEGELTAQKIFASSSGTIGGWEINGNTLNSGSLTLDGGLGTITANMNGSSLTFSGKGLVGSFSGGSSFSLGSTGLSFNSGGTNITAGGKTSLTENLTNLGGVPIKQRIEELAVGTLTADRIESIVASINILYVKGVSGIGGQGFSLSHSGTSVINTLNTTTLTISNKEVATKDWVTQNFQPK